MGLIFGIYFVIGFYCSLLIIYKVFDVDLQSVLNSFTYWDLLLSVLFLPFTIFWSLILLLVIVSGKLIMYLIDAFPFMSNHPFDIN